MPTIDPFSPVSLFLTLLASGQNLSTATGFLCRRRGALYLVTNWHVLAGRNPATGRTLDQQRGAPDHVRVLHHGATLGSFSPIEYSLSESSGSARWLMHPRGQEIDVAALRIDSPPGLVFPINELDQTADLQIGIGRDVFVLGFPFGLSGGNLPIWKRASIASEPELDINGIPYFYLDTATRPGMSGSPVLARSWINYEAKGGHLNMGTGLHFTRFVGIYSGRLLEKDILEAQLGKVWREETVLDVIDHGIPGGYQSKT